jgi:hypothetical protein
MSRRFASNSAIAFLVVFMVTLALPAKQVRTQDKVSLLWSDQSSSFRVYVYGLPEISEDGIYTFTVIQGYEKDLKVGTFHVKFGGGEKPPPGPPPPPSDVGYGGKLWCVLVLPDNMDDAQASMRTDPSIREIMAKRDAIFRSYLRSEEEISGENWKKTIESQESIPVAIWVGVDPTGKSYIVKSTKWPFSAKDLESELIKIRGK